MTNTTLQSLITTYGDRINCIILDNNVKIFIGYPSSTLKTASDIKLETVSGEDFFKVYTPSKNPSHLAMGVAATLWYPSAIIQAVSIMEDAKFRLDPLQLG